MMGQSSTRADDVDRGDPISEPWISADRASPLAYAEQMGATHWALR